MLRATSFDLSVPDSVRPEHALDAPAPGPRAARAV